MSMGQLPDLLTVAEVATWLRVSDETVYRLHREETLPAVVVSQRNLRWRRADVEAFIARNGDPVEAAS
jgi:excisionase family DNA binding protein